MARRLLMIFGICSVMVLILGTQIYLVYSGLGEAITFGRGLLLAAPDWYPWLALAPAVLWVTARFPLGSESLGRSIGAHVLSALIIAVLYVLFDLSLESLSLQLQGREVPFRALLGGIFLAKFMSGLMIYAFIVAGSTAVDYRHRYRERALKASQLEKGLAEARLRSLEMQLHPHFLFNTLNAISSLMRRDVEAADRMISRLSSLLRYTLEAGDVQLVTLDEEISILKKYMEIEEARFGERLQVNLEIPREVGSASVPILLLQPLVENAIRHGVAPRRGPGQVSIQACRRGDVLHIEVVDDGVGLPPGWTLETMHHGVGLANTCERLSWLFGASATLSVQGRGGPGVRVALTLPFRPINAEGGAGRRVGASLGAGAAS